MRIYSDVLTVYDLHVSIAKVDGMYILEQWTIARPKVRSRGWNLATASTIRRRRKNSGYAGGAPAFAASYDDHGHWFALLFEIDGDAVVGPYKGRDDFHKKTENRYQRSLVSGLGSVTRG